MVEAYCVGVTSPRGKMGVIVSNFIEDHPILQLCATVDRRNDGCNVEENLFFSIEESIQKKAPQIFLIFSPTDIAFNQALICLKYKVIPIIGSTGFTEKQLQLLKEESERLNVKLMIIPNFAIGAVLMMKFAAYAAKYMEHVEILEMHHPQKKDSPSGTAKKLAEMINVLKDENIENIVDSLNNSRGMNYNNVRIHSIRLEGVIANHQVIFGGNGETLTLKHNTVDRSSFLRGIELAISKIDEAPLYTYGLEQLLD